MIWSSQERSLQYFRAECTGWDAGLTAAIFALPETYYTTRITLGLQRKKDTKQLLDNTTLTLLRDRQPDPLRALPLARRV